MEPSLGALKTVLTLIDTGSAPKLQSLASQNAHFQIELLAFKQLIGQTKAEENKNTAEQQREMLEVIGKRHDSLVRQIANLKSSAEKEVEFVNYMLPMFYQARNANERRCKLLEENPVFLELSVKVQSLQEEIDKLTTSLHSADEDMILCEDNLKILKQQASRSTEGSEFNSDAASSSTQP